MNNRICLNDLVERSAKSPHLPAYESGGWGLSYGQLLTRARVLAAALEQLWPGEGPILLYGHKQPALPVGMLACRTGENRVPSGGGRRSAVCRRSPRSLAGRSSGSAPLAHVRAGHY